jgi:uncharacterized protein
MKVRQLVTVVHRDAGYFLSALIVSYCVSGIALNHIDDWNPDFIIQRLAITIPDSIAEGTVTEGDLSALGAIVGEQAYRVYDQPGPARLKVYYDNATLMVDLQNRTGNYERIVRRPLVYQTNVLHRNSVRGWKWASDVFAAMLIAINLTGLFILKGKQGLTGRGKWFIAAGIIPPLSALVFFEFLQR